MTGCDILVYMPRIARIDIGDEIYHVINRANGRAQIFNTPNDYRLFEELMEEAKSLRICEFLRMKLCLIIGI